MDIYHTILTTDVMIRIIQIPTLELLPVEIRYAVNEFMRMVRSDQRNISIIVFHSLSGTVHTNSRTDSAPKEVAISVAGVNFRQTSRKELSVSVYNASVGYSAIFHNPL
jgi:hypothetical protein